MDFTCLLGGDFDLVTYRDSKCGLFREFNDSLFSRPRQTWLDRRAPKRQGVEVLEKACSTAIFPQRSPVAGFRYRGGRVLRALRWPSLCWNYRDSWRQRCRASRGLFFAQVCNYFHHWLENVGRSHRCYQLVWYVRSTLWITQFPYTNENLASEAGKHRFSRKPGDIPLTFPRWHISAPMGHVRNDLPFWIHLEYRLCLWDHLDPNDCFLCKVILLFSPIQLILPRSNFRSSTVFLIRGGR